jgi:hypothetical protein
MTMCSKVNSSRVFGFRGRTEARLTGAGWVFNVVETGGWLIRLSTVGEHDPLRVHAAEKTLLSGHSEVRPSWTDIHSSQRDHEFTYDT